MDYLNYLSADDDYSSAKVVGKSADLVHRLGDLSEGSAKIVRKSEKVGKDQIQAVNYFIKLILTTK